MCRLHKLILAGLVLVSAAVGARDWRGEGKPDEQMANLVQLVPGTSHWMMEMGERYKNLYWAARQEKWEFAAYQGEKIEKLVKQLMLARPARAPSAETFLGKVFPMLHEAIAAQDWDSFEPAFRTLNAECLACHVREDHGFIQIPPEPATASSPVLNMK